jgi:DNA (cytosine-5)-methyltransferase 1
MDNLNDYDPITVIEFCAGYGGLGLGIKGVLGEKMRLIGLCELEGFAQANLISKMEAGLMAQVPIWSNLLTFPYQKFRGLVDIAAAGIPCQPHSLAGKRSGGGDERFLFDDWLCGLEQMQPRAIFIENVEGFLSSKMPDGTLCVEWTIKRLEAMGYQSATGIFSAREVGAPHQRKRVFILAMANSTSDRFAGGLLNGETLKQTQGNTIKGSSSWPSRPNQPQYAFEPPRVVGNSSINGLSQYSEETRGQESCGEQGGVLQSEGASPQLGNSEEQGFGRLDARQEKNRRGENGRHLIGSSEIMGNSAEQGREGSGRQNDSGGTLLRSSDSDGSCANRSMESEQWQAEPPLGGDADGTANWMDYAELSVSCDNRTDELRLLGNGVVPATATLAFQTLLAELLYTQPNL